MNKFRVEYLVGKTPPMSSLYLNGHSYSNVVYRMMPETKEFPDLESAQQFFGELENSWETEDKLYKDRSVSAKPHIISIKLLELQEGPEYRKWVVLKKSDYNDWFDANKSRFLTPPEEGEGDEEDLQEVDGNEVISGLFGGTSQETKDAFAKIENEFSNSGLDAWISRTVSTPNRIVVMGGFMGDSMQGLHVEEIMKRNGYAETKAGSDYVMYEKQQIAMQEKKKKQVTIKESELRKVVEANVRRKLMEMDGGLFDPYNEDPDVRQHQIDMAYAEKAQQDNGMDYSSYLAKKSDQDLENDTYVNGTAQTKPNGPVNWGGIARDQNWNVYDTGGKLGMAAQSDNPYERHMAQRMGSTLAQSVQNGMNDLSKVGEPTNEGRKVVVKESELREYVAKNVKKALALSEEIDMGQVPSAQDMADRNASRQSARSNPEAQALYKRIQDIRKNFDEIEKFGEDVTQAVEKKLHELVAQYQQMIDKN